MIGQGLVKAITKPIHKFSRIWGARRKPRAGKALKKLIIKM
jgi:hypothetical protein